MNCFLLTIGCLFLYSMPGNKKNLSGSYISSTSNSNGHLAPGWCWRISGLHLSATGHVGIAQQYPCTFSKTIWNKACQISVCVFSLKIFHIFLKFWGHPLNGETFQYSLYTISSLSKQMASKQLVEMPTLRFQHRLSYKPKATAAQSVVLLCIQASLAEIRFLPNQSVYAQKIYVSFYRTAIANMRYVWMWGQFCRIPVQQRLSGIPTVNLWPFFVAALCLLRQKSIIPFENPEK